MVYDYQRTRGGEHPRDFLSGFKGYLHVDGYPGYHKVKEVTLVGCWAHARRKYDEALKASPEAKGNPETVAAQGLAYCNELFAIERELQEATPEERHKARAERSRAVLDTYHAWLCQQKSRTMPKSLIGQAIAYSLNQWEKLTAFLKDGRLEIDNNRSERSIKPFVIGRKNWLFANTPRGASARAAIYSVIETAKENGLTRSGTSSTCSSNCRSFRTSKFRRRWSRLCRGHLHYLIPVASLNVYPYNTASI